MKKNLALFFILISLLGVTYYFVEILPKKEFVQQNDWIKKVESMKSLTLEKVKFTQTDIGWVNSDGKLIKQDFLMEFSQIIRSFYLTEKLVPPKGAEYFTRGTLHFKLDDLDLYVGDLTPVGDKFYLRIGNDRNIYLIALDQIASKVMGSDEQELYLNKWLRLRDFIAATNEDWLEKRMIYISSIGAFDEVKIGDKTIRMSESSEEFQNAFSHLQWEKEISDNVTHGSKLSFWLNQQLKSEWLISFDRKITLVGLKKTYLISEKTWHTFFEIISKK